MTKAIGLFAPFCFKHVKLERIYAYVNPANVSSWNLLESCGFKREGLLLKHFRKDDEQFDCYMYGLTKDNINK